MSEDGYKQLISYKLSLIAFDLGWDFVPIYYKKYEDNRQRDQIKQALRSFKQNIVEGSSERSLSSKLKLYDVSKASSVEAKEDFLDILRREGLKLWGKDNPRLIKLRLYFESNPSNPPYPSLPSVLKAGGLEGLEGLEGLDRKEGLDIVLNYEIDLLIRAGYLLDRQINAVEEKHRTEGGYKENLFKKRLEYKNNR